MSSSYENRWLSTGDETKKGSSLSPAARRKSVTPEEANATTSTTTTTTTSSSSKPVTPGKENKKKDTRPHNTGEPAKKSQKEMTKAERRAIQEKQRLEKQNRIAAGLPKSAKQAAELEAKKGTSSATKPSSAPGADAASEANKQKKKALSKNQQNQVPWLLHLDAPKTSEAMTKDLHPAVLQLGLYFSEHKIVGSNARCVAMLEIFSKVKKK
jgi:translation initiation factor eIF-2B subunit delta